MKNTGFIKFLAIVLFCAMGLQCVPGAVMADSHISSNGGTNLGDDSEMGYILPESADPMQDFSSQLGAAQTSEGPYNKLGNAAYNDFGFSLPTPEGFTSDENPLQDYKPLVMSQLYLGVMNKSKAYTGAYTVYNTMPALTEVNATIYDESQKITNGKLQENPISPPKSYSAVSNSATTNNKYCAHNAVSVSMGVGEPDKLVELSLYTGQADKKTQSYLNLKLLTKDNSGYTTVKDNKNYLMSDRGNDAYKNINVMSTAAVTSMAAGDFDRDGYEEVAIYYPTIKSGEHPSVKIFDVEGDSLVLKSTIPLSDLSSAHDPAQFSFKFKDWLVPVVNLTKTSISGTDDLVINVSLPYRSGDSYKKHAQTSSMGIYRYYASSSSMQKVLSDNLSYSYKDNKGKTNVEQMRFVSAQDGDVNGNGINELVLAGYRNYFSPYKSDDIGKMAKEVYLNFVVWEGGGYKVVFNSHSKLLKATHKDFSNLSTDFSMMEPVSLATAKLSQAKANSYIFAAGAVAEFVPANLKGVESYLLSDAKLIVHTTIDLSSAINSTYVSTSIAGYFSNDRPNSEQIVVMSARGTPTESLIGQVSYDISWVWMQDGEIQATMTNHNFISGHQTNNSGTFLTMCEVGANDNASYYSYLGKTYGWSAPAAMIALPALPYWKELPASNGIGDYSFTLAHSTGHDTGGDFNIGGGISMSLSGALGGGAAGNSVMVGLARDFTASLNYAYTYMSSRAGESSIEISKVGDRDYVVAAAIPMVCYKYDMWVPEMVVDQAFLDVYNPTRGPGDPVYKVGDVIAAHSEEISVNAQFAYEYVMMPLEQYNALCRQYGIDELDMSGFPHTVGDPSTYPGSFSQVESYPSEKKAEKESLRSSKVTVDASGNGHVGFSFLKSHEIDKTYSIGAQYSENVKATLSGQVQIVVSASAEFDAGYTFEMGGHFTKGSSKVDSSAVSAYLNYLDTGHSDYTYGVEASIWLVEDVEKYGAPYYMGYAITLSDAPPKPPENVYAYGQTTDSILLSWDLPDAGDPRRADEYEIYAKNTTSHEYEYLDKVNALTKNHFLVTGLSSGTEYEFAFKAKKTVGVTTLKSGFSKPFFAFTQSEGGLEFITNLRSAVWVSYYTEQVSFNVEAKDTVNLGNTITYLWQEYIRGEGSQPGEWVTLENSNRTLTLSYDLNDGRTFRALASSRPTPTSPAVQTIISRTTVLHVGPDTPDPPRLITYLELEITGGAVYSGEIFAAVGEELTLTATVCDKHPGDHPVEDRDVTFGIYANTEESPRNAEPLYTLTGTSDQDGKVTVKWAPPEAATYRVAAHCPDTNIPNIPIFSDFFAVHSGNLKDKYFSITYILNGGENDPRNPLKVYRYSTGCHELQPASNKPYATFDGWYSDAAMTKLVTQITPVYLNGDLVLYAKWNADSFNVTYKNVDPSEHNNPATYTMYDGRIVLEDAERDGYIFEGWHTNIGMLPRSRIYYLPVDDPYNLMLYAKWSPEVYNITYVLDGGVNSPHNPDAYTTETPTFPLDNPTKVLRFDDQPGHSVNFTFAGWYTAPDLSTDPPTPGTQVTEITTGTKGDITLYATWTFDKAMVYFDVRIYNDTSPLGDPAFVSGSMIENMAVVDKGTPVSEPTPPTRSGFIFDDWYTDTSYTTTWNFADNVTDNMILYAKWDDDPSRIVVTFEYQDSEGRELEVYASQNSLLDEPRTPWRTGYSFAGWYTEPECTNQWDFITNLTGTQDMTLYAKWEILYRTIGFNSNGGSSVRSITTQQGTVVSAPAKPTKKGYTFDGWYVNSACTVYWDFTRPVYFDMNLYAKWTKDSPPPPTPTPTPTPSPPGDIIPAPDKWVNPFIDVREDDWFYKDIEYVYRAGIFAGTSPTTYSPYTSLTRAMMVTVFWRLEGKPISTGTQFTDVPNGSWYSIAAVWAKNAGIVKGVGGGQFAPNEPISRQDIVVMITRYLDYKGYDYKSDSKYVRYTDENEISSYALPSVEAMTKLGVIRGRDNFTFVPKGNTTRGEAAALVHRMIEMLKN